MGAHKKKYSKEMEKGWEFHANVMSHDFQWKCSAGYSKKNNK